MASHKDGVIVIAGAAASSMGTWRQPRRQKARTGCDAWMSNRCRSGIR